MPLRKKLKKIFHHRNEEAISESPSDGPSENQQSSLSIKPRPSYVATMETSRISPTVPALEDASAPQQAPDEELLAPTESHNSIRQSWAVAYKSLRDEEDSPVQAFEDQIHCNMPDIADRMSSDASTKDWMSNVVQIQMDQVKRDTLKLRFGNFEMEAQEVVKSVLAVVNWSKDYVSKALSSNPTASIAWGGVTLLLPVGQYLIIVHQASSLAKGLEHIASIIVRSCMWEDLYVRRYESATSDTLPESHAEYRRALEMLYQEVLRFQIVCYGYYSHKSVSRLALDSVKHNGWDELVGNIKYRENEFDKVSQGWRDKMYNDEWEKAEARHQQAMNQWRMIGTDVSKLRKTIEETQKDRNRERMLDWLCTVDTSVQYRAAREKYSTGTCNWLIQEGGDFTKWKREYKSFLWLNGKAGSGKSILSSSVIKHLKDQYKNDPETAIAYFFFSFRNVEQQKVSVMLSSLIRQLCASRPDTPQPIKRFEDYMARGERPDIEILEAALMSAISGFSAVFIVVDALDECPAFDGERPKLLKCLRRVIASMPDTLHIFCTSRAEPDIRTAISELLEGPAKAAIDLTQNRAGLNRDLRLYIDTVLDTGTYFWWSVDVKAKAKNILIARADGMFQYLVCQFEVLQYLDSEASVLSALNDLPTGLDETYDRLLLGLNSKFKWQILGALKWLALSREPLHLDVFAEIFIFRPETVTNIHKTERLFDPRAVLKHFPSLVTTQQEEDWNYGTNCLEINTYVRLAHFTVKEYLISERIEQSRAKEFCFTEANAHLYISHCCLSYHLYQSVEDRGDDDELPLKSYAVRNWELHLELVQRELWTHEVIRLAELALSMRTKSLEEILFAGKLQVELSVYSDRVLILMQRPYCYTAANGFLELTKLLLQKGSRTRRFLIQEDLDLALRTAAEEGHIEIVRFLLNERANPNKITGGALQAAAFRGHLTVIKLLLDNGADIDAHDDRFGSALEAAAMSINLSALRMLLDRGASVSKAGCPISCLIAAYEANDQNDVTECTQVLKLLLDKGADINRKCARHRSSLNEAIRTWLREGIRGFFDFLVRHNADIELDDGFDGNPLQAACSFGGYRRKEAILTLLRLGADPNAQGGEYGNALQSACYQTDYQSGVVDLLLVKGAKINQKGGRYGTALHAACATRSPDLVLASMLLSRGADVHIHGGEYGSVLQAATSVHAHKTVLIVQKLLDSGADVNAPGGKFGSALQAAAYSELSTSKTGVLVESLLKKGANVNMQGGMYGTALQSACVQGNIKSVRLLLSYGAEVNIEGGRYGTALQAACVYEDTYRKQHYDLACLLIDHGADVHVESGYFGSAWHAAAAMPAHARQAHDTLRLLLDNGVDVNRCHTQHGTALQVALEHMNYGIEDRILFLLKNGANVNLGAGLYGYPLQSACLAPADDPTGLNARGLVYLLKKCANVVVNQTGGLFGTALQAAAYAGKTDGVKLLLEKGADVNLCGGKYGSALNAAAVKGYWDIVEILLETGAKADCYLFSKVDEEWLEGIGKEDGFNAMKRYRNFWDKILRQTEEVQVWPKKIVMDSKVNKRDFRLFPRCNGFHCMKCDSIPGNLHTATAFFPIAILLRRGVDELTREVRTINLEASRVRDKLLRFGLSEVAEKAAYDDKLNVKRVT
ncbi:ankyrin repeat [Fusarium mexicanum]|uniref:Ankyrin repeat n=1 Tax=Fusarium mexicanum TaxID=751941 RepID=A0A8H5J566_9HYPO|nr:ankyrin repeat [Fusarium mexicanum]